jgi:hypothetical protein
MIDDELFFQDIPYDQKTAWLDLGRVSRTFDEPGIGAGQLIICQVTARDLQYDAAQGGYVYVEGENVPGSWTTGYDVSVGIGLSALTQGGIKFALPSNVSRYVRFSLGLANPTAGVYTVKFILED